LLAVVDDDDDDDDSSDPTTVVVVVVMISVNDKRLRYVPPCFSSCYCWTLSKLPAKNDEFQTFIMYTILHFRQIFMKTIDQPAFVHFTNGASQHRGDRSVWRIFFSRSEQFGT
jgi:hypothetical protein